MLTDTEITALAREYAEEKVDPISFKAYADPEFKKELYAKCYANEAKEVIEFLLRRYELVEKAEVKRLLKEHRKENRGTDKGSREWFFYNGRLDLLKSLFPDLGKEVEE